MTDLSDKAYGMGKSTYVVPADQLIHCPPEGEARPLVDFWVDTLCKELVANPSTIPPTLVVNIKYDPDIQGTASLADFVKFKKSVMANKSVQFELLSKNHFVAATKRVRCTLMHCSLLMLGFFLFLIFRV